MFFKDCEEFNSQPFISDDFINQFPEQSISAHKSCGVPMLDYNPEFEISTDQEKLYRIFESEMIFKDSGSSSSNFFGWSSNCQPVQLSNYEKIQKYYKTKSKIIHLFSLDNYFALDTEDVVFGTISVFLLEEDLLNGVFDMAWMIPCFD